MVFPAAASKRTTVPTSMFSLVTNLRSSIAGVSAATAPSPSLSTASAIFCVSARNALFLAVKSVSDLSCTSAARLLPTAAATAPSRFSRSERSAALAKPFLRNSSTALSKSPSLSMSAFLQSIMPAPVASRRRFTSFAVISAICSSLVVVCRVTGRRGGNLCRGDTRFTRRRLGRSLGSGLRLLLGDLGFFGLAARGSSIAGALGGHVATFHHRVGNDPRHDLARADGVIVTGDQVV